MCKCEGIIELNNQNPTSTADTTQTSAGSEDSASGLVSYPFSLCLRFSPPNKDVYIAAGNYEEISKWRDILSIYCKRPVRKTESSPAAKQECKETHLADIEDFENIDDLEDDEEPEYEEEEEEAYEYDENEFMTLRSDGRKNAEFYYSGGLQRPPGKTSKNKPSLSSSSSSSSSSGSGSNLTRKRNESLKLKMMSGIRKSKSKGRVKESEGGGGKEEKASLDNSNNSSSSSHDGSLNNELDGGKESGGGGEGVVEAGGRRMSYKEDDLVRKQRLKDNLNQLLIEYKHEEEQQLKKSSKFSGTSGQLGGKLGNRMSLDSSYAQASGKMAAGKWTRGF